MRKISISAVCLVLTWLVTPFLPAAESTASVASVVVIQGGQLFDPVAGKLKPVAAIFIQGDRITAVVPEGEPVAIPGGAKLLDARGRFLIPGLIDAHVHLVHILRNMQITADEILPLFLANGVTTLRDVGDEIVAEKLLFKFAEAHPESAPRLFLCSMLIDGNPPYHQFISWPITDPARVPAFVDEMTGWGVQTFKIYFGIERPVGQAVIQEAHRRGKWVTAHLGKYSPQDAVEDGIDSIEHIGSILDFVLPAGTPRWPTAPERVGMPAADQAALQHRISEAKVRVDLSQPPATDLIAAILRHKVAIDPTLVVYKNWMLLRDLPEVQQHSDLGRIPKRLLDGWRLSAKYSPLDPLTLELRRGEFAKQQELTGRLYRAGVELMVGTDTPVQFCPPGFALQQELELLVASGLTPAAALTAATRNNARTLGQTEQLGSIEPGKLADVVILEADPLADIRNTRKIFRVIRSGVICDPAELFKMVPLN
jgi:hypothetical protein